LFPIGLSSNHLPTPWRVTPFVLAYGNVGRALWVVRAAETGVISFNSGWSVHMEMPFGGVKRSGSGRELGLSALEHYSEQKSMFIAED